MDIFTSRNTCRLPSKNVTYRYRLAIKMLKKQQLYNTNGTMTRRRGKNPQNESLAS
jgi:hypothetical protein